MSVVMDGAFFDLLSTKLFNKADETPQGPAGEFTGNVLAAMAYLAEAMHYWERGHKEDKAFAEDRVREALACIKGYEL